MNRSNRKKDIAVIGMSGLFSKSNNITAFWENLVQGKELVHFYDSEEIDPEVAKRPNYVPVGSLLENSDSFDYAFFGYTKEEALLMDPQIRIMHQQVYAALDNAGYTLPFDKETIGLYLSASDNLNWRLLQMLYPDQKVSDFLAKRLSNKEFISTLISYKLGLKGPSFYVATACSASLSNIHLACRSLLLKECNIAVSGGVSIQSTEDKGYFFEEGLIASRDGHCKAFDKDSSGTIWGEGAGVVVLKRYEDAVRDNDFIYAVINATAVNNDGKRKVGYTAPSVEGQSDCIKMAHKIAGITPEQIHYVEAHGTGTNLGDPIEIEALNKAFNFNTNHSCAIGSVKTNMGHLDAAAGIAGFIKACLCVHNRIIPPSLHFNEPNPNINFKNGPFYVNQTLKKWDKEETFRVGVSSFGIGGTNCHAVLEEAPQKNKETSTSAQHILMLSAKTKKGLNNYKKNLATFLKENTQYTQNQISYSVNKKAQNFSYNDFVVFENTEKAINQLQNSCEDKAFKKYRNIVFLFSGQGTQYVHMAKELYTEIPFFKNIMNQGFKILSEVSGKNFKGIIGYEEGKEVNTTLINNTLYTQPLLFLVEYAMAKTLMHLGISPTCMIGHSLGEYTAACISNVFSFEDGLKIVYERASLMSSMETGDMIAIASEADNILHLAEETLSIAAINSPNTCVLSGKKEDVAKLALHLEVKGIKYSILKTSHAFHSHMMDPMLPSFEEILTSLSFNKPEIPFVSNLTGKMVYEEEMTPRYWKNHVRNAVLFKEGVTHMLQQWNPKETVFIEVGPGRTLLNLLRQISPEPTLSIPIISNAKEQKSDYKSLLNCVGLLWKTGVDINTEALYKTEINKVPVPSYAFDTIKLPSKVDPLKILQQQMNVSTDINAVFSNIDALSIFNNEKEVSDYEEEGVTENYRINLTTNYAAPETELQTKLCAIWSDFLGVQNIGIEDSFFELGGDSLKGMSILNAIKKEFDCEINVQELYENLNVKNISLKIEVTNKLKNINKKVLSKNKITI